MADATNGDTVRVHYTGRLTDGTVFDSSRDGDPLDFELGSGQVIPGFDSALEGMSPGEEKTVEIPCDEAYGPRDPQLMLQADPGQLPPDIDPEVGQMLQLTQPGGQPIVARVAEVGDDEITLDANHPLAGKDLEFEIELVDIV